MFTVDGAAPLWMEVLSQFPPSEVLFASVQFKVPDPALRIWTGWLGGARPPVFIVKLNWPGTLSKNALEASETVRVTGTVIAWFPVCDVKTIWPV
jgi:hypothetical protein